jgi:inorganic triphosphatase YgiF
MESNSEIELKLSLRPDDLPRVAGAPWLKPPGARRAVTRTLESVYYDTPDLMLRARNLVLRVRKIGQRYIQTIKTKHSPADAVMNRREWEARVAGVAPDFSRIADEDLRKALDSAAGDLAPAFTTQIRRTTRMIERSNEASVELAIDQGEVVTPRGSEPVCEIELELKQGKPGALYDLALALNEIAPVHLETRSKSDRGYALLRGDRLSWSKAGQLALDPGMNGAEALTAIIRHNLAHLIANEPVARDGRDPEGVHQVRLALRRLRSALAVFRPLLPVELHEGVKGELRWLAGELGPARDLDVFIAELLGPVKAAFPDEAGFATLEAIAREARGEAYEHVHDAFGTARYTALLLQLGRLLETSAWQEAMSAEAALQLAAPARGFASDLLADRHRKARKRGRHFAALSPEERHELRIRLKRLRYAAEFFRSLYDKGETMPYLKRLSRLQDDLGHLNDVETATRLLTDFEERGGPKRAESLCRASGLVTGWHSRGAAALGPKLRKKWRAFKGEAPFWTEAQG